MPSIAALSLSDCAAGGGLYLKLLSSARATALILAAAAVWSILSQVLHNVSECLVAAARLLLRLSQPDMHALHPVQRPLPQYSLKPCLQAPQAAARPVISPQLTTRLCPSYSPSALRRRFTVVLDLDETLICAYRTHSAAAARFAPTAAAAGHAATTLRCEVSPGVSGEVTVFQRPCLVEFLQRAAQFADLVVFTASLPGYAQPILDILEVRCGKVFAGRLFRQSTVNALQHDNVKDLSQLGSELAKTVIVENNPFSFILQPSNGLLVRPFLGDPTDDHLLTVVLPILEGLAGCKDVRPILDAHFHMDAWFARRRQAHQ